MAYQALYRKWRPMRFDDFVGQENVIATLRNQVQSGHIAHAYLFCGTRGTGKTSAAKVLARAVNCATPQNGDPCGACAVCLALAEENNLDIVEIDAASNNGVDEIRDLREKVKYPPQTGRYRVYIIDEVHMLSTGAFNALLKTLEEPPAYVVFILATTEPQRLPATILSRCQRFDFRRIPAAQIITRLKEAADALGMEAQPAALERIARAAEGGMRDAFSIMDMCLSYAQGTLTEALVVQVLGASDRDFLFRFAACLLDGDSAGALTLVDELMRSGREPQVFARDISGHLRTILMAKCCGEGADEILELTKEDTARYLAQGNCSTTRLMHMLDLFLACETDMKWASQPRIALEVAVVRACEPEEGETLNALSLRLEALEKQIAQGVPVLQKGAAPTPSSPREQSTPAAPAAQAAAPSAPPPGNAQGIWEETMRRLRKDAPSISSSLMLGRFVGQEDDVYTVAFPQGSGAIFAKMFENEEKRSIVEQVLCAVSGTQATLRAQLEGAPSAQSTASGEKTLNQIIGAFGRENVEIIDE